MAPVLSESVKGEIQKMKIIVMDGYAENPGDISWDGFEKLGELTVYDRTPYRDGNALIVERAKGAEIVITNKTPLTAETLRTLMPELRYIGVLATGYNVVDVKAARELGVPVTNIPTYGTAAVAQFTMALLLEMCHHAGEHSRSVKAGDWSRCPDFCYWNTPLVELSGKIMGLIGYGRIGKAVARLAGAFGMRVLAYDRASVGDDAAEMTDLEELLRCSDVISLHCPLFPETQGIINRQSLALMKDGVMLINTARGPLIDEAALCEALQSGKIAFAALDVQSSEPPREDHPFYALDNCILTPHIAWAPRESRIRLMNIAVSNLEAFLQNRPVNVVNP